MTKLQTKNNKYNCIVRDLCLEKPKHNREIIVNDLKCTRSQKTCLKDDLNKLGIVVRREVKIKRIDGITLKYKVVIITPNMMKDVILFKYEKYKNNLREDSWFAVIELKKIYNYLNNC